MDSPLPWRVFRISDYEWWVARTLQEAIEDAARQWGYLSANDPEVKEQTEDAYELSDEAMHQMQFRDSEEPDSPVRTFREELALRVAAGLKAPEPFAGEE